MQHVVSKPSVELQAQSRSPQTRGLLVCKFFCCTHLHGSQVSYTSAASPEACPVCRGLGSRWRGLLTCMFIQHLSQWEALDVTVIQTTLTNPCFHDYRNPASASQNSEELFHSGRPILCST
ncbi:uncharacterized protein ACIBXB_017934 isoform 1-T1 [Morphnus guianensis]